MLGRISAGQRLVQRELVSQLEATQLGPEIEWVTSVDILTRDPGGNIGCIECKSSDTAPLANNQNIAFPLVESQGAVIVGKGKPGFEGGTVIPPTKVQIVRPPSKGAGK